MARSYTRENIPINNTVPFSLFRTIGVDNRSGSSNGKERADGDNRDDVLDGLRCCLNLKDVSRIEVLF